MHTTRFFAMLSRGTYRTCKAVSKISCSAARCVLSCRWHGLRCSTVVIESAALHSASEAAMTSSRLKSAKMARCPVQEYARACLIVGRACNNRIYTCTSSLLATCTYFSMQATAGTRGDVYLDAFVFMNSIGTRPHIICLRACRSMITASLAIRRA